MLLLRDSLSEDDLAFVDSIAGKQVVAVGERAALHRIVEQSGVATACAARIRSEIERAATVADAAGFPGPAREGMRPLRISGALKVAQGVTSLDEIVKVAPPADEK